MNNDKYSGASTILQEKVFSTTAEDRGVSENVPFHQ
jgi:hypothetical protein